MNWDDGSWRPDTHEASGTAAASGADHAAPLLEIRDLAVTYRTRRGGVPAVKNVSVTVERGTVTAIVGESGSGKSTSAMATLGLLPGNAEVSGTIKLDGRLITNLSEREWRSIRGTRVGLIPQDPNNSLNPVKTIGASVGEGLRIAPKAVRLSASARKKKVLDLLEQVGIDNPEVRYDQYPHQLSGGMKQRALIAAAVATEPELIIADEPTSALDVTVQRTILDLLDRMRTELDLGILFITHDLAVAGDRADQLVVMQGGEVKEHGPTDRILTDPHDPYTRRLLSDAPSLVSAVEQSTYRPGPAPDATALLTVDTLRREFGGGDDPFVAVDDVSFTVAAGTTHAIVGESGSGKSTLARMITAFQEPTSGTVTLDDLRIDEFGTFSKAGRRDLRRRVQMVYQNPFSSLDPRQTVGKILAEPLRNLTDLSKTQIREKVEAILDRVALGSGAGSVSGDVAQRRPAELSGGQRQRVAIARALILDPELVVLDEAVSALDVTVQAQILSLLDELQRDLGLTYLFISHDLSVVREISDTVTVMSHGRQVESGLTSEIFEHPQDDFTEKLLDAIPGHRYRSGGLNLGL
ncbi:dipeptide ABC transporter ATP-binding protein [Corynebacterium variabile]|uniref:dipeptide ABC transporter ATP-binding protein n=2 Tax=Corynebacterium variabile TaxID=1727 RepID=UPI00264A0582|nr:ABC transporter ATP-binding protein [Corynebacterium variabile]MDN6477627.1 ABC transporter ATP-binding protein [Corynebacterium variabile]MDN6675655.1 ABC transporter ATP-binding protein [Corynebacterium variabile]MDN6843554.1 ABC transporter ATP-binding protein [Corynebacterium variabile]